jgi:hypothetical protein
LTFSDHESELDFSDFDDDVDEEEDDEEDIDVDLELGGPQVYAAAMRRYFRERNEPSPIPALLAGGWFGQPGIDPLWDDEAEEDGSENSDEDDDEEDEDEEDEEDEDEDDSFIDSRSETEILAEGNDSDVSVPYNVRENNFYTQPDSSIIGVRLGDSSSSEDGISNDEEEEIPARPSRRLHRIAVETDEESEESDDTVKKSASTGTESSSSSSQQNARQTSSNSAWSRRSRNAIYISDDD